MILKEFEIDRNTHIGGWYISEDVCDDLIKLFERTRHLHTPGYCYDIKGPVVDTEIKESTDFRVVPDAEMQDESITNYLNVLHQCVLNYMERFPEIDSLPKFTMTEPFNIQHYKPGGGFKKWHFENANLNNIKRCLVFMTYLNDVSDGGTEFKYQNLVTPAKKGLTLLWPPNWTHTHRGQISHTQEKYIATGWYAYI